jgi:hypothetical protein
MSNSWALLRPLETDALLPITIEMADALEAPQLVKERWGEPPHGRTIVVPENGFSASMTYASPGCCRIANALIDQSNRSSQVGFPSASNFITAQDCAASI